MGTDFAADATFDYVIFRILPENRYDACICNDDTEEMVGQGPLDQLLEHLPSIKDQIAKGSCDSFKLELPNTVGESTWFTKVTVTRFLHIIGSSDIKNCVALSSEMSQLEEARKFHLSLYTKADGITSTDTSKNELLRAMDSRIAALTEELVAAFNLAAGTTTLCFQEMTDLQKFSSYFGDANVRNLFSKLSERAPKRQTVGPLNNSKLPGPVVSKNDYVNKSGGSIQKLAQSNAVKPVQYNASPAKAAEFERQSSSDSEESSFSSEDDQPPAERSRTLIRSASPRRSASPMRKIQIGRSGSRRTPALAIKSLPYFPSRDRISSCRDTGNAYDSDLSEEPIKKTEVNVTRLSVQDAISMFEKKQKDDIVDGQKQAVNDNSSNANKAVLRRWSSGTGESQKSLTQSTPENTFLDNKAESLEEDNDVKQPEVELDTDNVLEIPESEDIMKADMGSERRKSESVLSMDNCPSACETSMTDKHLDSAEWSRQKEEELNQMLMKFSEYSLSTNKNIESDNDKNRNSRSRQRTGLSSHQKGSKDDKLKRENGGKKFEKPAEVRAKKKVLDKAKTEKPVPKVSDANRKQASSRTSNVLTTNRTLNVNKSSSLSSNPKKESPKPDVVKKAALKSSTVPATRKSWPSTPSPRASGTVAAKISTGPPSVTSVGRQKSQSPALRQKPQLPASSQRPSPRVERSEIQQKGVKKSQVDTKKNLNKVDDSKSRVLSKSGKPTKPKTPVALEGDVSTSPVKAILRKKGTKKSSVVPLETKPSRSKNSASNSNVKKVETPSQSEQAVSKYDDPDKISEDITTVTPATVHPVEAVKESDSQNGQRELETELAREIPDNGDGLEISAEESAPIDGAAVRLLESPAEVQSPEEPVISPAAWEENSQQDQNIPVDNRSSPSPVNHEAVASSGTRVRHSLSQMLLEESSEPDIIEWGNAEHPPAMIYQKDAPKGFKRLLKFARKNKGETNGAAWSSPYTSEGEDDGDEYKSLGKRHSENLLKVALHSKNNAEGFLSDSEPLSARSNMSNSSARSSSKFQEGHTSKGTRSFFSLSAFRGNKS